MFPKLTQRIAEIAETEICNAFFLCFIQIYKSVPADNNVQHQPTHIQIYAFFVPLL